jgi:hypothetical protein
MHRAAWSAPTPELNGSWSVCKLQAQPGPRSAQARSAHPRARGGSSLASTGRFGAATHSECPVRQRRDRGIPRSSPNE